MNLLKYLLPPVKLIKNGFSQGNASVAFPSSYDTLPERANCYQTYSGALTANVYKELISITGAGLIHVLFAITREAAARTLGIKLVIDGVTVFDAVSDSMSAVNRGMIVIGIPSEFSATNFTVAPQEICYTSSFKVSIKSNLTDSNAYTVLLNYSSF